MNTTRMANPVTTRVIVPESNLGFRQGSVVPDRFNSISVPNIGQSITMPELATKSEPRAIESKPETT